MPSVARPSCDAHHATGTHSNRKLPGTGSACLCASHGPCIACSDNQAGQQATRYALDCGRLLQAKPDSMSSMCAAYFALPCPVNIVRPVVLGEKTRTRTKTYTTSSHSVCLGGAIRSWACHLERNQVRRASTSLLPASRARRYVPASPFIQKRPFKIRLSPAVPITTLPKGRGGDGSAAGDASRSRPEHRPGHLAAIPITCHKSACSRPDHSCPDHSQARPGHPMEAWYPSECAMKSVLSLDGSPARLEAI
jgi:hypothetical protein